MTPADSAEEPLPGPAAAGPSGRTRIILLGTGTPNADPDRSGPSVAIVVDDQPYLVDFGPGVVRRAAAAQQRGVEALDVARLDVAFVTHLHSDHTAGYPDLWLTPWVLGRDRPLRVIGPPGLAEMTRHVRAAWAQDIRVRLEGREPINDAGHRIEAREVMPGEVHRDELVTVRAFAVTHGDWDHAYGYRFDTPDRSIVISGDTTPSDAVVQACDGCDVLIHEVYCRAALLRRQPRWRQYHQASHTSAPELAALATRARPRLLILYHQLLWDSSADDLMAELRAGYQGEVSWGHDLDVY